MITIRLEKLKELDQPPIEQWILQTQQSPSVFLYWILREKTTKKDTIESKKKKQISKKKGRKQSDTLREGEKQKHRKEE